MILIRKIFIASIVTYIFGACNPQSSYKTLSIFFDGVPPPQKQQVTDSLAHDKLTAVNSADMIGKEKKVPWIIHEAYSKETCGDCHDKSRANSLSESLPDLCYQCHENFSEQYENIHAPVDDGECTACHNPHKSKNASLLIVPKEQICLDCHDFKDVQENEEHEEIQPGDCLDCHNPHGGGEFLL